MMTNKATQTQARQEPLPEANPQEVDEAEAPLVSLPEPALEPAGALSVAQRNSPRRKQMLQKLRNRTPRAAKRPFEFNLDRFELGLSLEEIIADLNYGVGPIADTAQSVHDDRPQVGKVT